MNAAHDKHNHPIRVGDLVEVVYGGDHHTLVVEEISTAHEHHYVHGSVTIKVPSTATSRRESENPTDAPREGTKVHVQEHKPAAGKPAKA